MNQVMPWVLCAAALTVLVAAVTVRLEHAGDPITPEMPVADDVEQVLEIDVDDPGLDDDQAHVRLTDISLDLAYAGREYLTKRPTETPDNCSRFISQVVRGAGVPMHGRVAQLWARAEELGAIHYNPIPFIGDLVFFNNTYDSNHDGRWNDLRTHIALVVDVEPDGTVIMVHKGTRREVIHMNLFDPHTYKSEEGRVLNSHLRSRKPGDPKTAMYLTGQNWTGYATIGGQQDWIADGKWEWWASGR